MYNFIIVIILPSYILYIVYMLIIVSCMVIDRRRFVSTFAGRVTNSVGRVH